MDHTVDHTVDHIMNDMSQMRIHHDDEDIPNPVEETPEFEEVQAVLYSVYEKYMHIEECQADYLEYVDKLQNYQYVHNPRTLRIGDYIRYIELKGPNGIRLNQGGIIDKLDSSIQIKSLRSNASVWRVSYNTVIFLKIK